MAQDAAPDLPLDVPSHADTIKLADKIDPFDPTGNRLDDQLSFRRWVSAITLRAPVASDIKDYGQAKFALASSEGVEKKELRAHLAAILRASTRGVAADLLMGIEDERDGIAMFKALMEEFGGKYDDG